jgi:hypothetical protein
VRVRNPACLPPRTFAAVRLTSLVGAITVEAGDNVGAASAKTGCIATRFMTAPWPCFAASLYDLSRRPSPSPSSYDLSVQMQTDARLSEPQRAIGEYL